MKSMRRRMTPSNWPSPDEVARRAAAVRATWSETERYRRTSLLPDSVQLAREILGGLENRAESFAC
ncbi:MAG: hypothetical protein WD403_10085 [Pirellulales bacterium]